MPDELGKHTKIDKTKQGDNKSFQGGRPTEGVADFATHQYEVSNKAHARLLNEFYKVYPGAPDLERYTYQILKEYRKELPGVPDDGIADHILKTPDIMW